MRYGIKYFTTNLWWYNSAKNLRLAKAHRAAAAPKKVSQLGQFRNYRGCRRREWEGGGLSEAGIAKTELIFLYAFFAWREAAGSMKDILVLAHQSKFFAHPVDILITVFGQVPNNHMTLYSIIPTTFITTSPEATCTFGCCAWGGQRMDEAGVKIALEGWDTVKPGASETRAFRKVWPQETIQCVDNFTYVLCWT